MGFLDFNVARDNRIKYKVAKVLTNGSQHISTHPRTIVEVRNNSKDGVPTFFPPKIPAKPFLYSGRSGKRSNSGKATNEKRLSVPYRRAFHGQGTFFAGFIDQDSHGKSLFFLSGSSCISEDAFLSGDFGREKCRDPICATRTLTKAGYAKFRHFLLYGEQGLAGKKTLVNIFQDTLTLEYGEFPLSRYSVEWQPDDRHLLRVGNPRLYDHPYQSPQMALWQVGEVEWHVIIRTDPKARRHKRKSQVVLLQPPLFADRMQG
jgi:hypothetical protein